VSKALLSERRVRSYERSKQNNLFEDEESLVFRTVEVWGKCPLKVRVISKDDGQEAMLVLGRGLVKSVASVYPGCVIRIFSP